MPEISVLICGKLRDRVSFLSDLEHYLELLRRDAVRRIVFSGWTSDLSGNSDLFDNMANQGIEVVLSDEPTLRTPGYVLHQAKSLHNGLTQFAPDDWVLKTRTDKVSWSFAFPVETLAAAAAAQTPVDPHSPFNSRVLVMGALLFQPFFMSDQLFVGKAQDLRRIANYDLWYERDHGLANTEQMLFFPAFRSQSPCTEAFFTLNPGIQYGRADLTSEIYRLLLDHPLYLQALREYMTALDSSFTLGLFGHDNSAPENVTWERMLNNDASISGTYVPPESGLRFGVSNKLPALLLDVPIEEGHPLALRELEVDGAKIQELRDDLAQRIYTRWPELPNLRQPDRVNGGLRIISSRRPLISS